MRESILGPLRLMLCILILITLVYGVGISMLANVFFKDKAQGSLLYRDHLVIGSSLIGQQFTQDKYFWTRPSLNNYQNDLITPETIAVKNKHYWQLQAHPAASASQVDPDISLIDAFRQIKRVAKARHISEQTLKACITLYTTTAVLGFGQSRVNVLLLNLGLDAQRDACHG